MAAKRNIHNCSGAMTLASVSAYRPCWVSRDRWTRALDRAAAGWAGWEVGAAEEKKRWGKTFRKTRNIVNLVDTRQMQDLRAGQRRQRGSERGPETLDSPLSASVRIASSKWRSAGRVRQHPSDLDVTAKPSASRVQSL